MEKLSRRHLINSSDVFLIKGFTVCNTVEYEEGKQLELTVVIFFVKRYFLNFKL